MHREHGIPLSINVGDMLSMLAMRPLLDNQHVLGPDLALRIVEETERMGRESAEGQAMELGWRRDNPADITERDYLEMVLKKTCWLATIHPSRVGALIGTRGAVDADAFVRFGFLVGAAFQIQDDLLNLVGDARSYGKELGGDIREGKRTLMLIHLFAASSPAERDRLHALLGRPREERTDADVRWVLGRMEAHGSIAYAREVAHGLAGAADHEFTRVYGALPESRDKQFIAALPRWVLTRS
jgi:geranylgeranyl diphosphate synthase type II